MNNHIYTTKAIILKSSNVGEANKLYFLLTKDFGLIFASAQGIRLEKSKLKGHLQDFNISNVSLVKGRDFWRIVSADRERGPEFLNNQNKTFIVKNVFSLLLRLIQGEEKNEEIFNYIEEFYEFICKSEVSDINLKNLETMAVLKVLHSLGYFKKNFSDYLNDEKISEENLNSFESKRKSAIIEINLALKHTQL